MDKAEAFTQRNRVKDFDRLAEQLAHLKELDSKLSSCPSNLQSIKLVFQGLDDFEFTPSKIGIGTVDFSNLIHHWITIRTRQLKKEMEKI